jgi:hypothetical protein
MNKKTLQKALDELNKDTPRIDYVRGILEVLIGDDETTTTPIALPVTPQVNIVEPPLPGGVQIGRRPINA